MIHVASGLLSLWLLVLGIGPGWLGVFLDDTSERPRVSEVIPESPAAKAGLRAGDLIVQVDGAAVATRDDLVAAIGAHEAGHRVRLDVERDGKRVQVLVRLGERPAEVGVDRTEPAPEAEPEVRAPARPAPRAEVDPRPRSGQPGRSPRAYLGASVLAGDAGIRIGRVLDGSPAQQQGLQAEDLLLRWGSEALGSLADLDARMAASRPGDRVVLSVRRGEQVLEVPVTLGERPAEVAMPEPDATASIGTDLDAARARAQAAGKPLLLLYGASWDGGSQAQRRALADAELRDVLAAFECVWVDSERHAALLAERHIVALPALEVERAGAVLWRHEGLLPAKPLRAALQQLTAAPSANAPTTPSGRGIDAVPPAPAPPAVPDQGAAPAAGDEAVRRELEQLRREVERLRAMLEELRRARGGGE